MIINTKVDSQQVPDLSCPCQSALACLNVLISGVGARHALALRISVFSWSGILIFKIYCSSL